MIFKVVTDFDDENILKKISSYNIILFEDALYISDVKTGNYKSFKNKIKSIFNKNCYLKNINEENLKYENQIVKDWCINQLRWAEVVKVEREQQEQIKNQLRALDKLEEEIFSNSINKEEEGVSADGGAE